MNTKTNTKRLMINGLLIAIGALLHQITPTLGLPMQPDFALLMMLIIVLINDGEYKTSLIAAIATGIFTALTTKFPGGQLPNIIDKVVTVHIVLGLYFAIKNLPIIKKFDFRKRNLVAAIVLLPVGTLISGYVFLFAAMIIVGLPAPFGILFMTVVLPATLVNLVAGTILYKAVDVALKNTLALR